MMLAMPISFTLPMALKLPTALWFPSQVPMRSRLQPKLLFISSFILLMVCFCQFTPPAPTELFQDLQFNETSFGERGMLAQILYNKILEAESSLWRVFPGIQTKQRQAEKLAMRLFPFIQHPSNPLDTAPLRSLWSMFIPKSKGIIILTGKDNLIFAC
jgi:hypothetical protein